VLGTSKKEFKARVAGDRKLWR